MKFIIDTNVLIVANGRDTPHASLACRLACVRSLDEIQEQHNFVLDNKWHVLNEYKKKVNQSGQPGVGDRFLKWILRNQGNRDRCEIVTITTLADSTDGNDFAEFPDDPALANFDRSDRKFVALALAHPERPPILNATDTDWHGHQSALEKHGVKIQFLCADPM